MWKFLNKHASRNDTRALSILELLVALSIFSILSLAIYVMMIFGLRVYRSHIMELHFARTARKLITQLEMEVKPSRRLIEKDNGNTLEIIVPVKGGEPRTSAFLFEDGDDDPDTIRDNVIRYDPDISDDEEGRVMVRNVSALPGEKIFSYPDASQPLDVSFRVGDVSSDPGAAGQEITGPGKQGLVIRASLVPRN